MATNRWRHLTTAEQAQVAQVDTFTITGVGGGSETWTFTLTDLDTGDTTTVTFVDDGSPTTTEITAGLVAAWNASTNPYVAKMTAADADPDITITADTAGRPFSLALAASGTGTVTKASTTASVGRNDYQLAANFSEDALSGASDDTTFQNGNVDVLYNLNHSATTIQSFVVQPGCQSKFGRLEFGKYHPLRIKTGSFDYRGNGNLALFDFGAEAIPLYVEANGAPQVAGRPAVYVKGSGLTIVTVARGTVGVAYLEGDTATVTTVEVGSVVGGAADAHAMLGSGITLTNLTLHSGRATMECAASGTALVSANGILTTSGSGTVATMTVVGTAYPNSSGTITTLNAYGIVDFTGDRTARTVTNLNLHPGCLVLYHTGITFTNVNQSTVVTGDTRPQRMQLVA